MPKGLKKIEQLAADAQARAAAYDAGGGDFQRALVLQKGQTAICRALEEGEGLTYLYTHELPKKPGQRFGDKILCLDQDDEGKQCKGCELVDSGVGRTARIVLNLIRYDEPKLVRDAQNKPVKDAAGNYVFDGVEPQVVVWSAPQGVGGRLGYLEAEDGGLTRHVIKIHRTADDKNPWMVDIHEKDKPPEDFERKLFESKLDPEEAITKLGRRSIPKMSYGDQVRAYSGVSVPSGFAGRTGDGGGQAAQPDNIYAQAAEKAGATGHLNLGAFGN